MFRQKTGENAAKSEIDIERPKAELGLEFLQRRLGLMGDEDIDAEALDPAILAGAETKRVRLLGDETPVEFWVDPFGHFHGQKTKA